MSNVMSLARPANSYSDAEPQDFLPSWKTIPLNRSGSSGDESDQGPCALVTDDRDLSIAPSARRLDHLFREYCLQLGDQSARKVAIDYGEVSYSYDDLSARANRIARFLEKKGIRPGERIALLLDRSIDLYATMLALSMLQATFVPLDPAFPNDRIRLILEDSEVANVITLGRFSDRFDAPKTTTIKLDQEQKEIEDMTDSTFVSVVKQEHLDPLAYIIYTSGSTGQPKGVPIRQSAICNFLNIARSVYGYQPDDRVFQGLSIAFDFCFEEIWVPLLSGATVVPAPSQAKLVGDDLFEFLSVNRITALCCVPTLLATIRNDLPDLRFLLVSGEACPQDLIDRWQRADRRILNAYGPTETTVTATWSVVEPDRAITIGGPLPTYSILIIDPDTGNPVGQGEVGEICVAGIGVFEGYLNRPEQSANVLLDDRFDLPDNPGGRIYRTGDLGRINPENQIDYLGRIDTQVKIRGFRIELGEIEVIARGVEGVGNAVVKPCDPDGTGVVLSIWLTPKIADTRVDFARVHAALKAALPDYMVPSYYDQLDTLPMLTSDKVDRSLLPEPSGQRLVEQTVEIVEPRTSLEAELALLLSDVLKLEQVSVEADFFDVLGADSLKLASFVTLIRKQLGLRRISMRKLYEHTTIADLAIEVEKMQAGSGASSKQDKAETVAAPIEGPQSPVLKKETEEEPAAMAAPASPKREVQVEKYTPVAIGSRISASYADQPHIPKRLNMIATGAGQVMVYALAVFVATWLAIEAFNLTKNSPTIGSRYLVALIMTNLAFIGTSAGLIAVKWIAVGRFDTKPIPIWSFEYFRFWVARSAIRVNPLNLFMGTPIYNIFLRLLGMKVGENTIVLSLPPVCTDLVEIGSRTVIREEVIFNGYTARDGYLYPGTVKIGSDVLICEATVFDINSSVADGSQIGACSAVLEGQELPAGKVFQGSPAEPSNTNFNRVKPLPLSKTRSVLFSATQIFALVFLSLPLAVFAGTWIIDNGLSIEITTDISTAADAVINTLAASGIFYFGGLLLTMITVVTVPRLLNRFAVTEVAHPIYGVQYELFRAIRRFSNNRLINTLFGDSSMIVHWLSAVGYDLSKTTQTGSNFGVDQRHHSPFLCSFHENTLVSDGLRMLNMETSSSSFVMRHVAMPPDTYVGNVVHYPADSKLGRNCLIATKAALPVDGPIRTNVGILGSPPFEIPRSVVRDQKFDHYKQPGIFEQRLRMKLRSNLITLGLYLARSWMLAFIALALPLFLLAVLPVEGNGELSLVLSAAAVLYVFIAAVFSIFAERLSSRFRRLEPQYCSLYDPRFWAHERFWKLNYNAFLLVFNGTPMKSFFLRLQGVKIGKRVFDDGCGLTEPSMVEIGDDCTLNYHSVLQCHSLEDGTFKSDRIRLGKRCTVGVNGFVHYGTDINDNAVLDADAFLMKGTVMEAGTHWMGNPAHDPSGKEFKVEPYRGVKRW